VIEIAALPQIEAFLGAGLEQAGLFGSFELRDAAALTVLLMNSGVFNQPQNQLAEAVHLTTAPGFRNGKQ
jgi:hypothetical protein